MQGSKTIKLLGLLLTSLSLPSMALAADLVVDRTQVANSYFQGVGTNVSTSTLNKDWTASDLATVRQRMKDMGLPYVRMWVSVDWITSADGDIVAAADLDGSNWSGGNYAKAKEWATWFKNNGIKIHFVLGSRATFNNPAGLTKDTVYDNDAWVSKVAQTLGDLRTTLGASAVPTAELVNEPKDAARYRSGMTKLNNLNVGAQLAGPAYYKGYTFTNTDWYTPNQQIWSHHTYDNLDDPTDPTGSQLQGFDYEKGGLAKMIARQNTWLRTAPQVAQAIFITEFGDGRDRAKPAGVWPDGMTDLQDAEASSHAQIRTHKMGLETADMAIQQMNGGAKALFSWQADESNRGNSVARWGLWEPAEGRSQDTQYRLTLRPWFYVHYLFSKYSWGNNATVYKVPSIFYDTANNDIVRATAVKKSGSSETTIFIVNKTNGSHTFNLKVSNAPTDVTLTRFEYTAAIDNRNYGVYNTQSGTGYPAPVTATPAHYNLSAGTSITIPARTVLVLTGSIPGG